MVVFNESQKLSPVGNDPIPVLNPALQAVRMALDMRTAIDALNCLTCRFLRSKETTHCFKDVVPLPTLVTGVRPS